MSENEPLVNENGDLLTEPYDNNVKMTADADALSIFDGQQQVRLTYDLHADEVKKGLLLFQKKTIFRKNIVYSVLLAIIFVFYVIKVIVNPKDGLALFLSVVSVAVVAFIWLIPANHRSRTAKAIASAGDSFQLTVCEKGLVAGEGETASYMFFENEPVEVYQDTDMMIFSICKERIFLVPRRCVDDADWEEATALLKAGLSEERFQTV